MVTHTIIDPFYWISFNKQRRISVFVWQSWILQTTETLGLNYYNLGKWLAGKKLAVKPVYQGVFLNPQTDSVFIFPCCRHFNELESSLKEEVWDALLYGTVWPSLCVSLLNIQVKIHTYTVFTYWLKMKVYLKYNLLMKLALKRSVLVGMLLWDLWRFEDSLTLRDKLCSRWLGRQLILLEIDLSVFSSKL